MPETNLSLTELKGLSKPVCKLIVAVQSAIGTLFAPTHVARMAKAEAAADVTRAKAEAEALIVSANAQAEAQIIKVKAENHALDLADRARERVLLREMARQGNIESISQKAIEFLPKEVNEENVDADWTASFFTQCQDVSDLEMQLLWAKLLAGEVARPGSYSLQTLALVKILRKEDALLFARFCSSLWDIANKVAPVVFEGDRRFIGSDLSFEQMSQLDSLGLIRFQSMADHGITFQAEGVTILVRYFGRQYLLKLPEKRRVLKFGPTLLTMVGKELTTIAGAMANEAYRESILERWRRDDFVVEECSSGEPLS